MFKIERDIGKWHVLGIIFMDQTDKCQVPNQFESSLMIGL